MPTRVLLAAEPRRLQTSGELASSRCGRYAQVASLRMTSASEARLRPADHNLENAQEVTRLPRNGIARLSAHEMLEPRCPVALQRRRGMMWGSRLRAYAPSRPKPALAQEGNGATRSTASVGLPPGCPRRGSVGLKSTEQGDGSSPESGFELGRSA